MRSPLLLLSILACAPLPGQIIFSSGFENWTDGQPDGFMGPHTTVAVEQLQAVGAPVHGGVQALRIEIGQSGPGQITTQPLAVEAGGLYTLGFWALGSANLTATVFDGRPDNDGYAPTSGYQTINSAANWTYVQRQLYVPYGSDAAEFVLRFVGGQPGSHLVIDDLTVQRTLADAPAVTIAQVQESPWPHGASPYNFQLVRTQGVVTGRASTLFYIQDGSGPWSGVQVLHTPPPTLQAGDSVTVFATVAEYQGPEGNWPGTVTQLIVVEALIDHGPAQVPPQPVEVISGDAHDEQWEGVLITVPDLGCIGPPDPFTQEWPGANWQGTLDVVALFHPHIVEIGTFHTITGVVHYAGEAKLAPRSGADFAPGVGVAELPALTARIYPNPTSEAFTVDLGAHTGPVALTITDATGRMVAREVLTAPRHTMDVSGLANGLYVLALRSGEQLWSTRVMVAR
ncbi:MAG: T9SS type A sorting domain-containing protein [Flavobacteriales bacterium]|jgi:hypothetical protein|nr:T9SS type A sorting domain-containing protein [Flavobacteriales bacterium]